MSQNKFLPKRASGLSSRDTSKLDFDNRKMEERLQELKLAMMKEKTDRDKSPGKGYWRSADVNSKTENNSQNPGSKITKITVLKDQSTKVPQRSKQPGTMGYIANRKIPTKSGGKKQTTQHCGQCDISTAVAVCVECGEFYCARCFAAFHMKGGLRKHKSTPIEEHLESFQNIPAQNISDVKSNNFTFIQQNTTLENEVPKSDSSKQSLLHGKYNEKESAQSFQAALKEWRGNEINNNNGVKPLNQRKMIHLNSAIQAVEHTHIQLVDSGVSTDSTPITSAKPIIINFHPPSSISYGEKLLLKKHQSASQSTQPVPAVLADNPNAGLASLRLGFESQTTNAAESHSEPESETIENELVSTGLQFEDFHPNSLVGRLNVLNTASPSQDDSPDFLPRFKNGEETVAIEKAHVTCRTPGIDVLYEGLVKSSETRSEIKGNLVNENHELVEQENLQSKLSLKKPLTVRMNRSKNCRISSSKSRADRSVVSSCLTTTPSSALAAIAGSSSNFSTRARQAVPSILTFADYESVVDRPNKKDIKYLDVKDSCYKLDPKVYRLTLRSWRPESTLGHTVSDELTKAIVADYTRGSRPRSAFGSLQNSVDMESSRTLISRSQSRMTSINNRPASVAGGEYLGRFAKMRIEDCSKLTYTCNNGRTSQMILVDGDDMQSYDELNPEQQATLQKSIDDETLCDLERELSSSQIRPTLSGGPTTTSKSINSNRASDLFELTIKKGNEEMEANTISAFDEDDFMDDFEDMERRLLLQDE